MTTTTYTLADVPWPCDGLKLEGGHPAVPGRRAAVPYTVACARWFADELDDKLRNIGIVAVTSELDDKANETDPPGGFIPERDSRILFTLPWTIDVERVKMLLEACDFCARNRRDGLSR